MHDEHWNGNASREGTMRVMVMGPQGHQQEIEAIIATAALVLF